MSATPIIPNGPAPGPSTVSGKLCITLPVSQSAVAVRAPPSSATKAQRGSGVMRRQAYGDRCNPGEDSDDRQQERGVASRQDQKTTRSALAATETRAVGRQPGSPRTARAMVSGASTPVAMINKNAIACTHLCQVAGLPATEHRRIDPEGGKHQRHPKQRDQHDRKTAPVRQLIAHCGGEHDQQACDNKGRNLRPPVGSACQRAGPRHLPAAHEFPAKSTEIIDAGPGIQPDRD
jgi:hypothetical protein